MLKTPLNPKGSRVLFLSLTDWLFNHNNVSTTACRKLLLLVRGVFGFLTVTSVYWSVHIMPLQDAAVLLFLSPCLVALASPFILGQKVNKAVFFSIPVAFIGVVLVAQPPALFGGEEEGMSLKNFLIGSSQAITASVAKLSVSFLGKSEPTAHIIMSMALVSCIGSSLGSLLHWKFPNDPLEFSYLLGVGICACLVQFTATLALKRSNTASVMSISYLGIIWSIIIDYAVFGMPPNLLSISGGSLVILSNLCLILYERLSSPSL